VPEDEREAMFFGGLFAYDLVAGFEDLPETEQGNRCPDYCFYLADPAGDRPSEKYTRIQASLFTPSAAEKSVLSTASLNCSSNDGSAPCAAGTARRADDLRC
jgi:anthranilate synthase component 1